MASITLHGKLGNPRTFPVQIAAAFAQIKLEEKFIGWYNETKNEEIVKLNPLGQIPVINVNNQTSIFQLNAILRFIARENPSSQLYGANLFESAKVDQWLDFNNTNVTTLVFPLAAEAFGFGSIEPEVNAIGRVEFE
jgi:glutathione S-transferase